MSYKTCVEYLDYQQSGKCLIQCDACKKLDHKSEEFLIDDKTGLKMSLNVKYVSAELPKHVDNKFNKGIDNEDGDGNNEVN